jgi:hypothetical protein
MEKAREVGRVIVFAIRLAELRQFQAALQAT